MTLLQSLITGISCALVFWHPYSEPCRLYIYISNIIKATKHKRGCCSAARDILFVPAACRRLTSATKTNVCAPAALFRWPLLSQTPPCKRTKTAFSTAKRRARRAIYLSGCSLARSLALVTAPRAHTRQTRRRSCSLYHAKSLNRQKANHNLHTERSIYL